MQKRILLICAAALLLGGCSAMGGGTATPYRCDRNGDLEQRAAC